MPACGREELETRCSLRAALHLTFRRAPLAARLARADEPRQASGQGEAKCLCRFLCSLISVAVVVVVVAVAAIAVDSACSRAPEQAIRLHLLNSIWHINQALVCSI